MIKLLILHGMLSRLLEQACEIQKTFGIDMNDVTDLITGKIINIDERLKRVSW